MLKDDSNGTGTLGSGDVFQPVSDMERKLDRKTRLQILLQLFQLACAMVSKACLFMYMQGLPLPYPMYHRCPEDTIILVLVTAYSYLS